jgi:DNA-directed RNA polymerase I, II, and III subunit RPABC2
MSEIKTQPEIIKDIIENDDNMSAIDDMAEEEIEQEEKDEITEEETVDKGEAEELPSKAEDEQADEDSPEFIPGVTNIPAKKEDEQEPSKTDEDENSPEFVPGVTNMPANKEGEQESSKTDDEGGEDEGEKEGEGEEEGEEDTPEVIPNKPPIQNATVVDVGPKAITSSLQEDASDDDSDDENEEVYQKLDKFKNKELLLNYHPETKQLKYADVMALTSIARDSENNIIDPMHKTIPILTRYERARVLGVRAKQLEHNAIPMIDIPANMIDSYLIACEELKQKKIPFIIKRPMPDGTSEYWKLEDLEIVEY